MAATRDPVMDEIRELFLQSSMTLDELGRAMGYTGATARKAAWQFVYQTNDPRLSMLRRFARAMGLTADRIVSDADEAQMVKDSKHRRMGA